MYVSIVYDVIVILFLRYLSFRRCYFLQDEFSTTLLLLSLFKSVVFEINLCIDVGRVSYLQNTCTNHNGKQKLFVCYKLPTIDWTYLQNT